MSNRASYVIVGLEPAAIWIADDNAGDRSVTNDAERVCRTLNGQWPGRRIFYFDTMNRCDELVHRDGAFIGFRPGPGNRP